MTIKDIKLSEFSEKELIQLENLIQAEKKKQKNARRNELCGKIIKDLEVFQREFSYECILVYCPECNQEIEIYPEDIISQIENNWMV